MRTTLLYDKPFVLTMVLCFGSIGGIRTVESLLAERKEYFIKLILDSGVRHPITPKEIREFNKVIDKVYLTTSREADACTSPYIAKYLYDRAKSLVGTATKLLYSGQGIDLDGQLPDAFSNKAILEIIIVNKMPYVFKFPFHPDYDHLISKDYEFCRIITDKIEGTLPHGLVNYQHFQITTTNNRVISGSISPLYVLSMNKLHYPVSEGLLVTMCNRLVPAISAVHRCKYVIGDIKPSNLFMDSNGNIDIGDFGGATPIGTPFIETSQEYAPIELVESNCAVPTMDWMCLINSLFEMRDLPKGKSCNAIIELVGSLQESLLKDMLNTILSHFK
jgi:serine/threonine protein kinase